MEQEKTEATEREISVASVCSADSFKVRPGKNQPGTPSVSFRAWRLSTEVPLRGTMHRSTQAVQAFVLVDHNRRSDDITRDARDFCDQGRAACPFKNRGDEGNRATISVLSVGSCSIHPRHTLKMPSAASFIDRQMGKLFLTHPLARPLAAGSFGTRGGDSRRRACGEQNAEARLSQGETGPRVWIRIAGNPYDRGGRPTDSPPAIVR